MKLLKLIAQRCAYCHRLRWFPRRYLPRGDPKYWRSYNPVRLHATHASAGKVYCHGCWGPYLREWEHEDRRHRVLRVIQTASIWSPDE